VLAKRFKITHQNFYVCAGHGAFLYRCESYG
jgi:hypothetical protein